MQNFLRDISLFVEVAKHRNFTKAAESSGMQISTLSKRISALEKRLRVSLFHRNTRTVTLTESGALLYERSLSIVAEAERAYEEVLQNTDSLSGTLRISMYADIYYLFLSSALAEFAWTWPDIRLHVSLSDKPVNLLAEPYDLDIQVGNLPDSTLIARKIYTIKPALYAAPTLLARYSAPTKPEDVSALPCVHLMRHSNVWTLSNGIQTKHVPVRPAHLVNTVSMWHDFALAGLGIGFLHPPLVRHHEHANTLVRLLPEWSGAPHDMHIVMASRQLPQRVRLFVDFLADFFARYSKPSGS